MKTNSIIQNLKIFLIIEHISLHLMFKLYLTLLTIFSVKVYTQKGVSQLQETPILSRFYLSKLFIVGMPSVIYSPFFVITYLAVLSLYPPCCDNVLFVIQRLDKKYNEIELVEKKLLNQNTIQEFCVIHYLILPNFALLIDRLILLGEEFPFSRFHRNTFLHVQFPPTS